MSKKRQNNRKLLDLFDGVPDDFCGGLVRQELFKRTDKNSAKIDRKKKNNLRGGYGNNKSSLRDRD
jgi:hypothetical protein